MEVQLLFVFDDGIKRGKEIGGTEVGGRDVGGSDIDEGI